MGRRRASIDWLVPSLPTLRLTLTSIPLALQHRGAVLRPSSRPLSSATIFRPPSFILLSRGLSYFSFASPGSSFLSSFPSHPPPLRRRSATHGRARRHRYSFASRSSAVLAFLSSLLRLVPVSFFSETPSNDLFFPPPCRGHLPGERHLLPLQVSAGNVGIPRAGTPCAALEFSYRRSRSATWPSRFRFSPTPRRPRSAT